MPQRLRVLPLIMNSAPMSKLRRTGHETNWGGRHSRHGQQQPL